MTHQGSQIYFLSLTWQTHQLGTFGLQCLFNCGLSFSMEDHDLALHVPKTGVQWGLQPGVDQQQMRLARRVDAANIQQGVVFQHRANASQDCAGLRPKPVAIQPCCFPCDPLAVTVGQSGLTVQGLRRLHAHPRCALLHAFEKTHVEFGAFGAQQTHINLHTSGL